MTDRDVDKLIAEKVMGWVLIPKVKVNGEWFYNVWCPDPPSHIEHPPVGFNAQSYVPFYSTAMIDTWRVVKKLQESGWHIELRLPPVGYPTYIVDLWRMGGHMEANTKITQGAESLEEAICLAALRTVGVHL